MKKTLNLALSLMFALFAGWQYNDPDPWRWAVIYGFVAVVCAWACFTPLNRYVLLAGVLICLVWGIALLPEFITWLRMGAPNIATSMKAETPYVEFTREFLGLGLCLAVLFWQYRQLSPGKKLNAGGDLYN